MNTLDFVKKKEEFEQKLGEGAELIKVDGQEFDGRGWYKCTKRCNTAISQQVWYWNGESFEFCMPYHDWETAERDKLVGRCIDMDALFKSAVDCYDNPLMRYKLMRYLNEEKEREKMVNILDGDAGVYRACVEKALKDVCSVFGSDWSNLSFLACGDMPYTGMVLSNCASYLEKYIKKSNQK